VYSKHFTPDDFICGGGKPLAPRHVLKTTAIPLLFPWKTSSSECTTTTSRLAAGEKQCSYSYLAVNSELSDESSTDTSDGDGAEFNVDIDPVSEVDCLQAQVADLKEKLYNLQLKYEKLLFCLE